MGIPYSNTTFQEMAVDLKFVSSEYDFRGVEKIVLMCFDKQNRLFAVESKVCEIDVNIEPNFNVGGYIGEYVQTFSTEPVVSMRIMCGVEGSKLVMPT